MIGKSLHQYVFIRVCIFLLQYATPLCLLALLGIHTSLDRTIFTTTTSNVLLLYSVIDIAYYFFIWIPYNRRLDDEARHPPPLSPGDRREIFEKVINHIGDFERYLSLWFLGADETEIKRDNVREFILWAFFDTSKECTNEQDVAEADTYVDTFERRLGREIEPGRGNARALLLTLDAVETRYRTFFWFLIVGLVDFATHCYFSWAGFQYYAQPRSMIFSVIPPRLHSLWADRRSSSEQFGYWYRPHTASDKVPVVFLHGIGIGLWTYAAFMSRFNGSPDRSGDIGIIALELLPVSFRLTSDPLGKLDFLSHVETILASHGWDKFVLAAHSYGSVLASHMIRAPTFASRIHGIVLMDPVSILLHLPDVAYNFTRREPRHANEWQLWYFASMDPGVAHALGRHFMWKENIIWKEELLNRPGADDGDGGKRHVVVCLAERDLIVDTMSVALYLSDGEGWSPGDADTDHSSRDGIEVLWFPKLDHGQMFDERKNQDRLCCVLQHICTQ